MSISLNFLFVFVTMQRKTVTVKEITQQGNKEVMTAGKA